MKLLLIISLCFWSFRLQATDLVGAISAGMGGTGRAGAVANETLFLNPAALTLFDRFYVGSSYQSGFLSKDISRNTYSLIMTDGTPDLIFPGALAYRRHSINSAGIHYTENEFRGGVGYRFSERINIGVAGKYLKAEQQNGSHYSQTNFDAGMLVGVLPNWGFSLSAENLVRARSTLPQALQRRSRVALGTQLILDRVITLRYEALMPLHTEKTQVSGHRLGASVVMKASFLLLAGYSLDDATGQSWSSIGLGWQGPRLKLAYSMQNEQRAGLGTRHFVDLWFDL